MIDELPRIGIVGVGQHAVTAILPALPAAGLRLVATCARHRGRAAAVGRRFGASEAYDDVAQMLNQIELDAAVVVVPPDQCGSVIRCCLANRVPVFVEKPPVNDAAEADDLAAQAADAGVPVMVGYMKRFAAAYQRASLIIASETFGDLTLGVFHVGDGPVRTQVGSSELAVREPCPSLRSCALLLRRARRHSRRTT